MNYNSKTGRKKAHLSTNSKKAGPLRDRPKSRFFLSYWGRVPGSTE